MTKKRLGKTDEFFKSYKSIDEAVKEIDKLGNDVDIKRVLDILGDDGICKNFAYIRKYCTRRSGTKKEVKSVVKKKMSLKQIAENVEDLYDFGLNNNVIAGLINERLKNAAQRKLIMDLDAESFKNLYEAAWYCDDAFKALRELVKNNRTNMQKRSLFLKIIAEVKSAA